MSENVRFVLFVNEYGKDPYISDKLVSPPAVLLACASRCPFQWFVCFDDPRPGKWTKGAVLAEAMGRCGHEHRRRIYIADSRCLDLFGDPLLGHVEGGGDENCSKANAIDRELSTRYKQHEDLLRQIYSPNLLLSCMI